MSDSSVQTNISNLGFTLLGILFVALKLTGVIDWSWWWVTLPFWGGLVVLVIFLACLGLAKLILVFLKKRKGK